MIRAYPRKYLYRTYLIATLLDTINTIATHYHFFQQSCTRVVSGKLAGNTSTYEKVLIAQFC